MTTTLIYGDAQDGYLGSTNASYATARNGPPGVVNTTGNTGWHGQNNNGGTYTVLQTFLRFVLPALDPAANLITSAQLRTYQVSALSSGVVRDLEVRSYNWGGGGLTAADWRTPAQMGADPLLAKLVGAQAATSRQTVAGSDELRMALEGAGALHVYLVSSRQRAGNTPSSDEGASTYTSEAGASWGPLLSYTYVPRSLLVPILGAEVQLSDGSWAFLTQTALGLVFLVRETQDGTISTLASIPLGTTTTAWADAPGGQGLCLAVDDQDTIYVIGRAGDSRNSLRVRAYTRSGQNWPAGDPRTVALPAYDAGINNVAATWHPTANGTLVVLAGHQAGPGIFGGARNEVAYALLDATAIRSGQGVVVRATGSAIDAGILPPRTSNNFDPPANDTGCGLDVAADLGQRDFGYVVSHRRGVNLGSASSSPLGRYILSADGAGFSHTSTRDVDDIWARKDAGAKLRAISVGSGQVAVVSPDPYLAFGLTVSAYQVAGSNPGAIALGSVHLAREDIPGMPDGPDVAASLAWDAVYSSVSHAVWVYYVDAADPGKLWRTSVDLSSHEATRIRVLAHDTGGDPILAVRVPRNARVTTHGHVTLATSAGLVQVVDGFNVPPLAPTLTAKANFDADSSATFAWTFQDPNPGDTQSAYRLAIERVSDGVTVVDTGKVASTAGSRMILGGTLANEVSYRWRVMTWDREGLESPWSGYGTFSTSAAGTVTIVDPAADNPPDVITDDYLIQWDVAGTTQVSYRAWVVRNDTGATVYDTGWITSTATSHWVEGMATDVEHTVRVQVRNTSGVASGIGARLITPAYGSPEAPVVTVTPYPEGGYVQVAVENPLPQGDRPEVGRNLILRRRAGSSDPWDVVGECGPNGYIRDYTVPGRVPVEYMARGEAA